MASGAIEPNRHNDFLKKTLALEAKRKIAVPN
jgi:hypothetical protein